MKNLLKISQQTLWQIIGKIVTSLSTFIILGIVARNYGPVGTGVFTLALTYLAIFYLLADFGFNAHVLKSLQLTANSLQREWQKLLGVRLLWSVFLAFIAIGLLPFWPFANLEFNQAVLLGSLAIIGSGIFTSCNLIFQSKLRYDLSVLASSIGTLASLAAFMYLAFTHSSIPFLLLAHLLGWIVIGLAALILGKRLLNAVTQIYDKQYTINLFKDSWPIAATLALNVIYFRADSFMIAFFRSSAEVGIYNVAYSVFQSALVLPTFIMNAYYPLMLRSLNGIKLVGLGLFGLASLGSLFTFTLAPLIVQILTGGGFVGSTESLRILSLGFPAYFLSSLLMWLMITKNKYKQMFLIYGIGLLINLILNFIFIPQYSFLAASWTTVISEYLILGLQAAILSFWGAEATPESE